MANLPELRSREQVIGDLIDGFLARVKDVNDLNRASVISQFFHAVGQSNFKAAADVITMIDALSVDRAEGEALQRLAADANVKISSGTYASGRVSIRDLSFQKISTNIFAGQPAPVAGSLNLFVVDASDMDANGGELYIGRGTPNVEGPLKFSSVQPEGGGAYWSITLDPSSPTTKFHNIGEEVVIAQGGNRKINSGTVVKTPSGSGVSSVDFKTVSPATIPDGEVVVTDVPVTAITLGTKGNVPKGAIREAVGLPFTATVFNDNAFVNGTPPDDEDEIRRKIKEAEQAKSKGTEQAIKVAAVGVISSDDLKKVQSSNIYRTTQSTDLIFDDGSGYEPIFSGVGLEQVIDDALGGERELQLRQRPVASARVQSIELAPFSIPANAALSVTIQGETTIHYFEADDFRVLGSGTAYEVASSINGDPNINFLAATANGGSNIVLYPRDPDKNDITINRLSSNDANDYLGFQTTTQYTLLLYKNDSILYQDGLSATVETRLKSAWSTSIANGDTLTYKVDDTPEIQVVFTKEVFQQFDLTATVNAFTDIGIWVKVFNKLMTGVIAKQAGEQITFTSARGESNDASIEITGGTLKDKIFETGVQIFAQGRKSDYTLNRQTGQIGLTDNLEPGDKISAGSSFTRANIVTTQLPDGPSSNGNVWMVVDGSCKLFASGLEGNTLTTFSKSGTKITIESKTPNFDPVGFDDVQVGDWCVVWPEQTDATNYPTLFSYQGFWRVESVQRGKIVVDDGIVTRGPTGTETLPTDRITFVRSAAPVQKLSFSINPLSAFVQEVEDKIEGVTAEVVGSTVRISTKTAGLNGELTIVAADSEGKALGISVGVIVQNIPSQKGFVVTEDSEAGMPSFSFSELGAHITDSEFVEPIYEDVGGTRDDFLQVLNRYNISGQDLIELPDQNKDRRVFIKNYNDTTSVLKLDPKDYQIAGSSVLKEGDRYILRTSYQFDSTDTATAIVDGDTTTKIFGLPVARKLIVNDHSTPSLNDFSADDGESSLPINDTASFSGFEFTDWKLWRQAATLLTDGSTYGLRVMSADHGPAGDTMRVGLVYPKSTAQEELALTINNAEMIDLGIVIPVTTARTPNWDGTSSFTMDVAVVPGTGKEKITYTWRVGTEPNFLAAGGGADVNIGDLAIINSAADFLPQNKDIEAKVTDVTATSFSIEVPANIVVSDNPEILSAQNVNRKYTIITTTPHGIEKGDRIGVWDTELLDGIIAPMDGAYFAEVINSNTFSVNLPSSVPGGAISSATHSSNLVICETPQPHGLYVGNAIIISGFNSGNYNGAAVVHQVLSTTKFSYVREGSSAGAINGRFDYQSIGPGFNVEFSSLDKVLGTVTVHTVAKHNLNPGDTVIIAGAEIAEFGGQNEVQVIRNDIIPASGDFQLQWNGNNTPSFPYNVAPGTIEAALNALPGANGGIKVTGGFVQGGYTVTFEGADGNTNQPAISIIANTLEDATGHNEYQLLFFDYLPTLGTFKVSFGGNISGDINPSLGNAHVQSILETMPSIGAGNVSVSGDPTTGYLVEFVGALADTNVGAISQHESSLLSGPAIGSTVQATPQDIYPGTNEIWEVKFNGEPLDGYYRLEVDGELTSIISWNAGNTGIQAALEALSNVGAGNVDVDGNAIEGHTIEFIGALSSTPIGIIKVVYDEEWDSGTAYSIGDTVMYEGVNYYAIQAGTNNQPDQTPAYWISQWEKLITGPIGAANTISNDGDDGFKHQSASLYANTEVGDIIEFTSGPLTGQRFNLTAKSSLAQDPAFNNNTTYTFRINSTIIGNLNNGSFVVKKPSAVTTKLLTTGKAAGVGPETNKVKVTTAVVNGAEIGDRFIVTSGSEAGNIYQITAKNTTTSELTVAPNVTTGLQVGDTYEIRRPVSVYNKSIDGQSNNAVSLTQETTLDGQTSPSYNKGDLVTYSGNTYEALINGATGTPDVTPTEWGITTKELNGKYVVSVINNDYEFEFAHYHTLGSNTAYDGTVTKQKAYGKLARSLGKSASVLEFAEIGTTAQEVVDFLTQDKSELLQAVVEAPYNGSESINTSTKDNDVSTGYLIGNALELRTIKASRMIDVRVDSFIKEGSTIAFQSDNMPEYDGIYAVFSQVQDGSEWIITLQSKFFAAETATTVLVNGAFQGYTEYVALRDGENSVFETDLASLIGSPQFRTKKEWSLIPTIGEEVRLVACNVKQLVDFWNRLVVTGISNVTSVESSEYARQLQVTTDKFGSSGSIQFTGGTANNSSVAIIGSGSELNDKVGVFTIPYELRRGLTRKSWVRMEQTVRLNKETDFEGDTVLRVYPDGIEILNDTPGSFQTKRETTHDETSIFRVEKHGKFIAVIQIGGQPLGLASAGVQEGDWVRFINEASNPYDVLQDYAPGDRVLLSGLNWTAVSANGPSSAVVNPIPSNEWDVDTEYASGSTVTHKNKAYIYQGGPLIQGQYPDDPTSDWELVWEVREWAGGNTGIFKVVRVFGDNAFWIENDAAVEQMTWLGHSNNIAFYSYDSVMPGDTLVVSGNILGAANAGRYTVRDETFGIGYSFPTSTRLWCDPITLASTASGITLGDSFAQVNVEEAEPVRAWKRILAIGPGESGLANVIVDSPNLVNRFSSSNAAYIEAQGKIGYDTVPAFGIDAYKHFGGLIKELNRVIYGDPTSPAEFPGVRAAGTNIGIREAITKRIRISLSVRVRTGISFADVRESIKAAVAGYVNNLGTGDQVALSKVVEAASKVNGVASVVITSPEYDVGTDLIPVGAQERPSIVDPTFDVTVSILGT